jgi:hypothetical protein
VSDGPVAVWLHPLDADLGAMARASLDVREVPDLRALVVASTGDTITVELVQGIRPVGLELLYVERRGAYQLARTEFWPGGRTVLVLRAWPARS